MLGAGGQFFGATGVILRFVVTQFVQLTRATRLQAFVFALEFVAQGIDFGVAPVPAAVPGRPSKPFVGVLGCMVSAASRLKDVAREFIENHLLKVESLKVVSADVPLGTPANKAYFRELAGDPRIVATMANAQAGEPIPNIPEVGRFWTAMDAALEAISNGLQSPKDALDGAAARMLLKK